MLNAFDNTSINRRFNAVYALLSTLNNLELF